MRIQITNYFQIGRNYVCSHCIFANFTFANLYESLHKVIFEISFQVPKKTFKQGSKIGDYLLEKILLIKTSFVNTYF